MLLVPTASAAGGDVRHQYIIKTPHGIVDCGKGPMAEKLARDIALLMNWATRAGKLNVLGRMGLAKEAMRFHVLRAKELREQLADIEAELEKEVEDGTGPET
jgi:hypothetical protein